MIYTSIALAMLLFCVVLGAFGGARVERSRVAAGIAAAMTAAQLALLLSR